MSAFSITLELIITSQLGTYMAIAVRAHGSFLQSFFFCDTLMVTFLRLKPDEASEKDKEVMTGLVEHTNCQSPFPQQSDNV